VVRLQQLQLAVPPALLAQVLLQAGYQPVEQPVGYFVILHQEQRQVVLARDCYHNHHHRYPVQRVAVIALAEEDLESFEHQLEDCHHNRRLHYQALQQAEPVQEDPENFEHRSKDYHHNRHHHYR
jgi:hypothetical protein